MVELGTITPEQPDSDATNQDEVPDPRPILAVVVRKDSGAVPTEAGGESSPKGAIVHASGATTSSPVAAWAIFTVACILSTGSVAMVIFLATRVHHVRTAAIRLYCDYTLSSFDTNHCWGSVVNSPGSISYEEAATHSMDELRSMFCDNSTECDYDEFSGHYGGTSFYCSCDSGYVWFPYKVNQDSDVSGAIAGAVLAAIFTFSSLGLAHELWERARKGELQDDLGFQACVMSVPIIITVVCFGALFWY